MNRNIKNKIEKFLFYLLCLLSTYPLLFFVKDKLDITSHKLIFNRKFEYENPKKIDIMEMEKLFNEMSNNQIILNSGFVVANDFLTYARSRNFLEKKPKNIIFENISKKQTLINYWDKNQKVSFILSCRYSNCKREEIELKNISINFKKSSNIISKAKDLICYPNNKINKDSKNFGIYDCSIKNDNNLKEDSK